ncbi:MAG TPA: RNA methyltransferase [Bacteroidales bacterium]|jgi:tRNA G18 (ribose-2'-O)-methylase SpoU|nr:RNA methyltransferase [Bacteroidales bacterium]|tara:strand:+ start:87 stop:617 length:531 start_codon:yes stop_codon:yes gene_type:complete
MAKKLLLDELNRLSISEFKKASKVPVVIVLDNIRSLSNIGSIFRTADAFRIEAVYLCGITAQPPHREIHKTALSATESVDWHYFSSTKEAVKNLKSENFKIISIEQVDNSIMLNKFLPEPQSKYALIFGNEVNGVGDDIIELSDNCIEIPQHGTKHSFNVSVSVGIILWDIVLKLK